MSDPKSLSIEPIRGRIYMVRGGHILRCHGPWLPPERPRNKAPRTPRIYCFTAPMLLPEEGPLGGASIDVADVLYEVTREHLDMLLTRRAQLLARNLSEDATQVEYVIAELKRGEGCLGQEQYLQYLSTAARLAERDALEAAKRVAYLGAVLDEISGYTHCSSEGADIVKAAYADVDRRNERLEHEKQDLLGVLPKKPRTT